jgi:hypothetical protein
LSVLDVSSFRTADCDTDHYLVVAKVWGETSSEYTKIIEISYGEVQFQGVKLGRR